VIPLVTAAATLGGGWLVSARVTDRWDRIKKRRDSDLAAAQGFQKLYGEFFALWKSWDAAHRYAATTKASSTANWECVQRAAATEGALEALLAKLASERCLTDQDIDVLGGVRQGFQSLRESIRAGKNLDWRDSNSECYSAFKGLCSYTSTLLNSSQRQTASPTAIEAATNFHRITDNQHELIWVANAKRLGLHAPAPA
jgi:hypothetical protein